MVNVNTSEKKEITFVCKTSILKWTRKQLVFKTVQTNSFFDGNFFLSAPTQAPPTVGLAAPASPPAYGLCGFHSLLLQNSLHWTDCLYTAISRKVVGKSAHDNPERYCGWFWVHCSSKKVDRMAREAMDMCLRVLKESNQSRFDSYKVRNSALIISHITFQGCRVHIFSDNLTRNSCIMLT